MIPRFAEASLEERLTVCAAVVMLGPRQVGKITLAKQVKRPADAGDLNATGTLYFRYERRHPAVRVA